MPDTKPSAFPSLTLPSAATDQYIVIPSGGSASKITLAGLQQSLGGPYRNASTSTVSAGYAADTYMAGSAVTVPAGAWKVGSQYSCAFDMTKTGAGTATPIFIIRMGTLGTTADANILQINFSAGTANADGGLIQVWCVFRTVGSGTSAVLQGSIQITHGLAATGLTSQGASGSALSVGTSAGFNSTTQTIIGVSFLGGASFSGTNTMVQATVIL